MKRDVALKVAEGLVGYLSPACVRLEIAGSIRREKAEVKDQLVLSRKDYHTQFEPLWYGWKGDAARIREVADRKQSDVWQIERPKRSDEHPTMKPLALVGRALVNSSLPGDVVLDPFVGSGTTLIVCEQLGRQCRAVELDPLYAAVTIERWHVLTGLLPIITP